MYVCRYVRNVYVVYSIDVSKTVPNEANTVLYGVLTYTMQQGPS